MRLSEIQSHFAEFVTRHDSDHIAKPDLYMQGGASIHDRLSVYLNNYEQSLVKAVMSVYELISALTGDEFAQKIAASYVRDHKPASGNMNIYGHDYADFIKNYEGARDVPYLADIARMEWALHSAYYAADEQPMEIAWLQTMDEEALGDLKLELCADVHIVKSEYPVFDIREFCLAENGADLNIEDKQAQNCLIYRTRGDDMRVKIHVLGDDELFILEQIDQGKKFEAIAQAADKRKYDLGLLLQFIFGNDLVKKQ